MQQRRVIIKCLKSKLYSWAGWKDVAADGEAETTCRNVYKLSPITKWFFSCLLFILGFWFWLRKENKCNFLNIKWKLFVCRRKNGFHRGMRTLGKPKGEMVKSRATNCYALFIARFDDLRRWTCSNLVLIAIKFFLMITEIYINIVFKAPIVIRVLYTNIWASQKSAGKNKK